MPKQAKIVFNSDRSGNSEIYATDEDGSNLRNLTDHPTDDWGPSWSPDGRRIVFCSDRDLPGELGNIYVMDADGENLLRLTSNPAFDVKHDWFDPDFAYAIFPARKLKTMWGNLKQIPK